MVSIEGEVVSTEPEEDSDQDDDEEDLGSCENCGCNLTADEINGLCEQCEWWRDAA